MLEDCSVPRMTLWYPSLNAVVGCFWYQSWIELSQRYHSASPWIHGWVHNAHLLGSVKGTMTSWCHTSPQCLRLDWGFWLWRWSELTKKTCPIFAIADLLSLQDRIDSNKGKRTKVCLRVQIHISLGLAFVARLPLVGALLWRDLIQHFLVQSNIFTYYTTRERDFS